MLRRPARIVEDAGLGFGLAAGKGSGETGGLERRDERVALADGDVGGIAGHPPLLHVGQLPRGVGDVRRGILEGQLNAGGMVVAEAPRLGSDKVGAGLKPVFEEEHTAGIAEGGDEIAFAVTLVLPAGKTAVADHKVAGADDIRERRLDGAAAQAGDGSDDLEGGAGRILTLDGAVEPAPGFFDGLGRIGREARHEIVEVVVGLGNEHEHLAGPDIKGHGGAGAFLHGGFRGLLQLDVEAGGDVAALHGQALFLRQVDLVAGGIHQVDSPAALALQLLVENLLQPAAANRALHLEGRQVLAGEVLDLGVAVDAGVAERVGGGGFEGIVTCAGSVDLQGRVDRQALDEARVFLGGEIVEQHKRQQQRLVDVPLEIGGADGLVAVKDEVDLVEIALGDGGAGNPGQLFGVRALRGGELTVVFLDGLILGFELPAQLGQVEHNGEARTVADEHLAVAVVDVAARAGHDDAALILQALALTVEDGLEQLAVGDAAGEQRNHRGDDAIEQEQPRIASAVGFDEAAHDGKGRRRGLKSNHHATASLGMDLHQFHRPRLQREEPRRDQENHQLRGEQVHEEPQPGVGRARIGADQQE